MLEHVTNLVADTKENSKPMKDTNSKIYRQALKESLGCFVAPEVAAAGMAQFDQLAKNGEREQMATEVVLNTLGLKEAAGGISEYVQSQLTKLGTMPKVETCSVKRLKELVKRLNQNIVKGGIIFNGKDLSELCLDAQIKVAPCMREQMFTYTSSASVGHTVNGKKYTSLVLETIGECRHE